MRPSLSSPPCTALAAEREWSCPQPLPSDVAVADKSGYSFVSLTPSLIAQISDVRQIGVRSGTLFAIISIASLVGNPIGGALLTKWNGEYTGLQVFAGVLTFSGYGFRLQLSTMRVMLLTCDRSVVLSLARVRLAGWKVMTKI